ncbi:MAG: hypothetical protein MUO99_03455, partial [Dehalococcoidales bacterium]|nr:hypothetical protein [Dehalococcoidales bacterium]
GLIGYGGAQLIVNTPININNTGVNLFIFKPPQNSGYSACGKRIFNIPLNFTGNAPPFIREVLQ